MNFSQDKEPGSGTRKTFDSDRAIAEALSQGSDKVAEEFVRQNSPWMLQVARRILHEESAAEDCVQEAFLSAFSKIDSFENRSTLKTWLHRIVVNKCLMTLRSKRRKAEEQIDDLMPQFDEHTCRIEEPWPRLLSADEICEEKELSEFVRDSIFKLPETSRIVLQLRDIEGWSTAEVADALEISESNVKVRLHRGRSALKNLLEPMMRGHLS